MKKMFVSHPYADNPKENMEQIDAICKTLLDKDILAISPLHLFSYMTDDSCREDIMNTCYQLIDQYPLIRTRQSKGCDDEFKYAREIDQEIVALEFILPCYLWIRLGIEGGIFDE